MKMIQVAVVAAMLTTGAAQAGSQVMTRYALDGSGNLVQQQYVVEDSNNTWKTVAIVAAIVLGVGGLAYLIDRNGNSKSVTVQQPNPLVPVGGTTQTSWTNSFVAPVYTPVN